MSGRSMFLPVETQPGTIHLFYGMFLCITDRQWGQ